MSVPLYNVPRYSRIEVQGIRFPDDRDDTVQLEFDHIDGMYSYCTDDDGNIYHLAAWTPVEIIREGPADGT